MSHSTLTQPNLAHTSGDSEGGFPAHLRGSASQGINHSWGFLGVFFGDWEAFPKKGELGVSCSFVRKESRGMGRRAGVGWGMAGDVLGGELGNCWILGREWILRGWI